MGRILYNIIELIWYKINQLGVIKVEREADELILLIKSFLTFVEKQYNNKKITEQEYEKLICKKISFIQEMENQLVCQ